ncbi:MAG: VOC family protein [Rhodospirillales bacterium]|nr:VOC family protein [Rhodospirillales bacterium]
MAVLALEHYNISPSDVEKTVDFYVNVVGLTQGFRPDFDLPGVWLYIDNIPVIHITERDCEGAGTGRIDHVAFRVNDMDGHIARLNERGIPFHGQTVPGRPMSQIFFDDPDGITIELNHADGPLPY